MQRNLETQTRPEVTPFLNTQTAASSHLLFVRPFAEIRLKKNPDGVYRGNFASLCGHISVFASNRKGEVSQDMRYPICLIRHLFLNRPHLHSLPRSIHKNTNCKRRLGPRGGKTRLFRVEPHELVCVWADPCRASASREMWLILSCGLGPQTCFYSSHGPLDYGERLDLQMGFIDTEVWIKESQRALPAIGRYC